MERTRVDKGKPAFRSVFVRRMLSLLLVMSTVFAAGWPLEEAEAREPLTLRVGETVTKFLGRIKNVQVGASNVIKVEVHPDRDKIVVFGESPGYSSLSMGDVSYDVTVLGDVAQLRYDVEALLEGIPGVSIVTAANRVVIDGVVKRRDDWDRIQALVESHKGEVFSLVILDERDIVRKAQVQLHFQVLEINRKKGHDIGVDWSSGPVRVVMDTISFVQFGPGAIPNPSGGITTPDDLINLQSTTDVRRILDKDFFTTVSGEEVEFNRGKELIFSVAGGAGGAGSFLVKEVGLSVKATPVIDDDQDIDLKIEIEFSTVGGLEFEGSVPAINVQKHKAHVQLREGESFALSGFFQREKGRLITGFPGLKDVPGLGLLFGSRAWQKGETDGIVVLTPVLVDPDRRNMRKQIKDALDIYDQADVKW